MGVPQVAAVILIGTSRSTSTCGHHGCGQRRYPVVVIMVVELVVVVVEAGTLTPVTKNTFHFVMLNFVMLRYP